jgi:formate/nitrite transporter FocA (FNT family)
MEKYVADKRRDCQHLRGKWREFQKFLMRKPRGYAIIGIKKNTGRDGRESKKRRKGMNKRAADLVKGIYGGFLIGIGGTVYLAADNRYAGAFLFCVGLFMICVYGLNLYTGKVGYFDFHHCGESGAFILRVWTGNFAGTGLAAILVRIAGKKELMEKAAVLAAPKLKAGPWAVLASAFFCGILMHLAVNTWIKYREKQPVIGVVAVFMGVMVFLTAGFDHSVANMFYFSCGGAWGWQAVREVLLASLGNAAGAVFIRGGLGG